MHCRIPLTQCDQLQLSDTIVQLSFLQLQATSLVKS